MSQMIALVMNYPCLQWQLDRVTLFSCPQGVTETDWACIISAFQTGRGGQQQQPQNNNQDVINLQYMELEEFLLENAVTVSVPEHKGEDHCTMNSFCNVISGSYCTDRELEVNGPIDQCAWLRDFGEVRQQ